MRGRFTKYLWIDFAFSIILFIAAITFEKWLNTRKYKNKNLTIQKFALEIRNLEPANLIKRMPGKFVYKNPNFWKEQAPRIPHSVHTFYAKKNNKNGNFFFGRGFNLESNRTFQKIDSHKSILTQSRNTMEVSAFSKRTYDQFSTFSRTVRDSQAFAISEVEGILLNF